MFYSIALYNGHPLERKENGRCKEYDKEIKNIELMSCEIIILWPLRKLLLYSNPAYILKHHHTESEKCKFKSD